MTQGAESSARQLRARLRGIEGDAGRLRLLIAASEALARESPLRLALGSVLGETLRFLAADSALVLVQEGGGLTVQAALGPVLPVGARLPLGGALGNVLRPPFQALMREHIESRLRVGRSPDVALELLLPLRTGGKAIGILALMSETGRVLPSQDDLQLLAAIATLVACACSVTSATRPRASRREGSDLLARLTAREQQVFALLPRGLSNTEIARELGIAPGTAKIHVEHILHKLGLKDRVQAAVKAVEWGARP